MEKQTACAIREPAEDRPAAPKRTSSSSPAVTSPRSLLPPSVPADQRVPADDIFYHGPPPSLSPQAWQLKIDPSTGDHHRQESAGWVSSLTVHLIVFLLLSLILAPADFGGVGTRRLIMTFSGEQKSEDESVLKIEAEEEPAEPEPEATPLPMAEPEPQQPEVTLPVKSQAGAPSAADAAQSSQTSGGSASPASGAFFGIEARGHTFVYVLDMSGSMRGRRYKRATDELLRSIRGLDSNQKFYVVLFNDSLVQMFDSSSRRPEPMAATATNAEQLARWLPIAFNGGSTDPREALDVALRMDPSAIFMLSDGEFDDPEPKNFSRLLGGNPDAFDIVAASTSKAPIHAIAFEDPSSCHNMKRLAQMTGGQYRFTMAEDIQAAKRTMAFARQAMNRGEQEHAETLLQEVCDRFGHTNYGTDARKILADVWLNAALADLQNDDVDAAFHRFEKLVGIDPRGNDTADEQHALAEKFIELSKTPGIFESQFSDDHSQKVAAKLTEFVKRSPKANASRYFSNELAMRLLDEARVHAAEGNSLRALKVLQEIIAKYPEAPAAVGSRTSQDKIIKNLLLQAERLREREGIVTSIRYLRGLASTFEDVEAADVIEKELRSMATEMLARSRDARQDRDTDTRNEVARQLREAFENDSLLRETQREFNNDERQARYMLGRATSYHRAGRVEKALEKYDAIVERYPHTMAAAGAQGRISELRGNVDTDDENDPVLLHMLGQ